jgi:Flp pilus assembly pilin Flp
MHDGFYKGVHMKKILKNQKGQGVMEYVIISSLVGIVCIAAVRGFGGEIKTRIGWMRTSITQNIDNQGR